VSSSRKPGRLTTIFQVRDELELARDVKQALSYMRFGLFQVPEVHLPVHGPCGFSQAKLNSYNRCVP